MKKLLYLVMVLGLLPLLTGCPKTVVNVPSTTLSGQIFDAGNHSIEGVKVTCGNQTIFSDSSGNFSIIVPIRIANVNFNKDGFFY